MKFLYFLPFVFTVFTYSASAEVVISDLRIKAPIPGQSVTAAYFKMENHGEESVTLQSVSSEHADKVSMHDNQMHDGMMSMIELPEVVVYPGQETLFEEGGRHLMIFSPHVEAIESENFAFIFEFSDGTKEQIRAKTESLLSKSQPVHSGHH